jgi:hypothetical protein
MERGPRGGCCPAFAKSVKLTSGAVRSRAMGALDAARRMPRDGVKEPADISGHGVWRDCRASDPISPDVMVLKTVSTIALPSQFPRPFIGIKMPRLRRRLGGMARGGRRSVGKDRPEGKPFFRRRTAARPCGRAVRPECCLGTARTKRKAVMPGTRKRLGRPGAVHLLRAGVDDFAPLTFRLADRGP